MKIRRKGKGLRFKLEHDAGGKIAIVGPDARKVARWVADLEPYHEAAHAVLSEVLGLEVDFVTVVDGEAARESGSETMTGGCTAHEASEDPHLNAVVAVAGVLWDVSMNVPMELATAQAPSDGAACPLRSQ